MEGKKIPDNFDYASINGLSTEVLEKLLKDNACKHRAGRQDSGDYACGIIASADKHRKRRRQRETQRPS